MRDRTAKHPLDGAGAHGVGDNGEHLPNGGGVPVDVFVLMREGRVESFAGEDAAVEHQLSEERDRRLSTRRVDVEVAERRHATGNNRHAGALPFGAPQVLDTPPDALEVRRDIVLAVLSDRGERSDRPYAIRPVR